MVRYLLALRAWVSWLNPFSPTLWGTDFPIQAVFTTWHLPLPFVTTLPNQIHDANVQAYRWQCSGNHSHPKCLCHLASAVVGLFPNQIHNALFVKQTQWPQEGQSTMAGHRLLARGGG